MVIGLRHPTAICAVSPLVIHHFAITFSQYQEKIILDDKRIIFICEDECGAQQSSGRR